MSKGYNPYRDPSNGRFTTGPSTVNKELKSKENNIDYDKEEADRLNGNEKNSQELHKEAIEKLKSDEYPSGTYDIKTLKKVDLTSGYQVSFWQIGDNYSNSAYSKIADEMVSISDGKAYAGKFEGDPEISYHVANREEAIRIAKKYNQKSVWDWEQNQRALEYSKKYGDEDPRTIEEWIKCEIKTGGTGRRK